MRIESSVTAISWIPSDAIEGMPKLPFELGVARYDAPPPDRLEEGDLERLRAEDRFREANRLAAWVEVDDGRIVDHGYEGAGLVGSTPFNLGLTDITIPGVPFEVLRQDPEVREDGVRFVQTVGGRAGFPAPRRVTGRPFVRILSATYADGFGKDHARPGVRIVKEVASGTSKQRVRVVIGSVGRYAVEVTAIEAADLSDEAIQSALEAACRAIEAL